LGHIRVDLRVRGGRGERRLENVLVDTGATYTVLPLEILEEVGAIKNPHPITLELGDGRREGGAGTHPHVQRRKDSPRSPSPRSLRPKGQPVHRRARSHEA